ERGVPKDKILRVSHQAENTREEAMALRPLAIERKWRRVIVVTSSYHTRRARYVFAHVFPASIAVRVSGAKDGDFDPDSWWERRVSIKRFATEVTGMVVAIWESWRLSVDNPKTPEVVGLNELIPQYLV